ncbi:MAG TPA: alpha/beta fold hydrolase [Candidatus Eremiobacteraceae bacterium]
MTDPAAMFGAMPPLEEFAYGLDVTGVDPASLGDALRAAVNDVMTDPARLTLWMGTLAMSEQTAAMNALRRFAGESAQPAASPESGDRRFADDAWRSNPMLSSMLESYLVRSRALVQLVDLSRLPEATRRKARFAARMVVDAMAPSNVPWLNPTVVREAMNSGGESLVRGMENFLEDVRSNEGRPRQVDAGAFVLGRNIGCTPGRVVLRNELMELIAYEPQTPKVYSEPILCSPPWINKYYIMDLAPGRSYIEWAVTHGFTVFCISYRNPDASMAKYTMDDYLRLGILSAIDRIQEITGSPRVNIAALCLGGTLAVLALAYFAATGQSKRVGWTTLTNSLIDFSEPGDLGVFTDESSIARLEKRMNEHGYLEAGAMAGTFDWMRANDLVWNYVVSNWYMGKKPPAFDILAWNGDSTRMPAAMHSQYLRSCYLHNLIVTPNAFSILDTPIDLGTIKTPMFVLGAETDHIAPWRSTYRTAQLTGGEATFVLTSSGHVAGIVNPPGNPKSSYWTSGVVRKDVDADAWRANATRATGSWWENWVAWAQARSGKLIAPPTLPQGDPAPGLYVRDQLGPLTGRGDGEHRAAAKPVAGNGKRSPAKIADRVPAKKTAPRKKR